MIDWLLTQNTAHKIYTTNSIRLDMTLITKQSADKQRTITLSGEDNAKIFDNINDAVNFAYYATPGWHEELAFTDPMLFCFQVKKTTQLALKSESLKSNTQTSIPDVTYYNVFNFDSKAAVVIEQDKQGLRSERFMTELEYEQWLQDFTGNLKSMAQSLDS